MINRQKFLQKIMILRRAVPQFGARQHRKETVMKNSNNNTYLFKGNNTIRDVNDASFLFGAFVGRELDDIGMRASYRHIIKPLMEGDGLTQLQLVNITRLKAPTISITLRNMEREGLVRREKNGDDLRETHVYITTKGKKLYTKILKAYDKAEKIMLDGISEEECEASAAVVRKMTANLRAALGEDYVE